MRMEEKISIFDIEMDNLTAKETMIQAMQFLESESIDTIEIMSMDMLLSGQEDMSGRKQVGRIGIVLPGDKEILTAADVHDRKRLQEAEERGVSEDVHEIIFRKITEESIFLRRQKRSWNGSRIRSEDTTAGSGSWDMPFCPLRAGGRRP